MAQEIKTLSFGGVNCYLVKTEDGFLLIDSGLTKNRSDIEKELENSGCRPGNLKLILITHGDSDHTGNAGYLRQKFGAKIAMHRGDSGMTEQGNMLAGRKVNLLIRIIAKILLLSPSFRVKKADRFTPDLWVEDGWDLSGYGFKAKAVHIPGHSLGSLGFLAASGDLYCGDLYVNIKRPGFSSIYIERPVAESSAEKLRRLNIKNVYPGHGQPFRWE